MPAGGMSLWLWLFLYRIIPVGLGLGFLNHKSMIPEQQRWSSMSEIWREIILSSYCAFIPIAILIAFEKKGAFGVKLGGKGPQKRFLTAMGKAAA